MNIIRTLGLKDDHDLATEKDVSPELLEKLLLISKNPKFLVNVMRGYPTCPICGYSVGSEILKRGLYPEVVTDADAILPWKDGIFIFPTLLFHMLHTHQIRLQRSFIDALDSLDINAVDEVEIKNRFKELVEKMGSPISRPASSEQ